MRVCTRLVPLGINSACRANDLEVLAVLSDSPKFHWTFESAQVPSLLLGKLALKEESPSLFGRIVVIGQPTPPDDWSPRGIRVASYHFGNGSVIGLVCRIRTPRATEAHKIHLNPSAGMQSRSKVSKSPQTLSSCKRKLIRTQVLHNEVHVDNVDSSNEQKVNCANKLLSNGGYARTSNEADVGSSTDRLSAHLQTTSQGIRSRNTVDHECDVTNDDQISVGNHHGRYVTAGVTSIVEQSMISDENGQICRQKSEARTSTHVYSNSTRTKHSHLLIIRNRPKLTLVIAFHQQPVSILTMRFTPQQLRRLVGDLEEHDYDAPTTDADAPKWFQYYAPQLEWIKTDDKRPTGWAPGLHPSVYPNSEDFRMFVLNNGCITFVSKYTPPLVKTIYEMVYATRPYVDLDNYDWNFGEQSQSVYRALGRNYHLARNDRTYPDRPTGEHLVLSTQTCEFLTQVCLGFSYEVKPQIMKEILEFVGSYKLKRNAPQADKDKLGWASVLESVSHKIPTRFKFLSRQNGFKGRPFVKLLSAIVEEYVQLLHPGYGFNYKMEAEIQDKKPLAHQAGKVTNWSGQRSIPHVTWKRNQIERALRETHAIPDTAKVIVRRMTLGGAPERPHKPDYEKYDNSRKEHKLERFNEAEAKQANKGRKRKSDTMSNGVAKRIRIEDRDAMDQNED